MPFVGRQRERNFQQTLGFRFVIPEQRKQELWEGRIEAVIAAIFLDSDFSTCYRVVSSHFEPITQNLDKASPKWRSEFDFKTSLQEHFQTTSKDPPTYTIIAEQGPEHEKQFIAEVRLKDKVLGSGQGRSKKDAEQMAAQDALGRIKKS